MVTKSTITAKWSVMQDFLRHSYKMHHNWWN